MSDFDDREKVNLQILLALVYAAGKHNRNHDSTQLITMVIEE